MFKEIQETIELLHHYRNSLMSLIFYIEGIEKQFAALTLKLSIPSESLCDIRKNFKNHMTNVLQTTKTDLDQVDKIQSSYITVTNLEFINLKLSVIDSNYLNNISSMSAVKSLVNLYQLEIEN